MEQDKINRYLENVNRNLKHLTISEKTDIINEIKSHIKEVQRDQNMDVDTILHNLGAPAELAKAYVGETIANSSNFNFKNLTRLISFYGLTGLSGMFVVPCISILSVSLYACSFIVLIGGAIKTIGTLLGFEVPFIMFHFGFFTLPGILALPVSIPFAALFYFCSKKLWKVLKSYMASVSKNYHSIKHDER